jgi:hypothetical protein
VVVVVDDASLRQLAGRGLSWPFPRDLWGRTIRYMDRCGARVVAFDVLFETVSGYDKYIDDDKALAEAIDQTRLPVVMATMAAPDGRPGPFAPPADPARVRLGAVNLRTDKTLRVYEPFVRSHPSLAVRVTEAIGAPARAWAREPFRLHYYGPTSGRTAGGRTPTCRPPACSPPPARPRTPPPPASTRRCSRTRSSSSAGCRPARTT